MVRSRITPCLSVWSRVWATLSLMIAAWFATVIMPTVSLAQDVGVPELGEEDEAKEELTADEVRERLNGADDAWIFGEHDRVVEILYPLLFPSPQAVMSEQERVDTYMLLGASQQLERQRAAAQETFYQMLLLEPDYEPDPFIYPGGVIDLVNGVRVEHQAELDEIRARDDDDPFGEALYIESRVESRSMLVSVLPFGIGHFYNDYPEWGVVYLMTEVGLAITSIAMFALNEGAREEDGFITDLEAVSTRQSIQLGTAGAFFLLLLVGAIHGAIIHDDVGEITYRVLDEPPAELFEEQSSYAPTVDFAMGGLSFGISGTW